MASDAVYNIKAIVKTVVFRFFFHIRYTKIYKNTLVKVTPDCSYKGVLSTLYVRQIWCRQIVYFVKVNIDPFQIRIWASSADAHVPANHKNTQVADCTTKLS